MNNLDEEALMLFATEIKFCLYGYNTLDFLVAKPVVSLVQDFIGERDSSTHVLEL